MQCVRERGVWVWFKHPYDAKLYVSSKANWRDTFTHAVPINPEMIRFKIGKFFHHGYSPKYANQLISAMQLQINRMNSISGYVVSHRLIDPNDPFSMEPCVMFASPAEAILFKLSYQV